MQQSSYYMLRLFFFGLNSVGPIVLPIDEMLEELPASDFDKLVCKIRNRIFTQLVNCCTELFMFAGKYGCPSSRGCALFPETLQNFSGCQILWRMYSVVFPALTLKLPIQTSFFMAPKFPISKFF